MNTICFHCREPVSTKVILTAHRRDGNELPVCCMGCKAAVEWIEGLGLSDYYHLRSEPAARAESSADYTAWDRPALARLHVRTHASDRAEVVVLIENLRCAACAWLIERALLSDTGVYEVGVNAAAKRVRLVFNPQQTHLSDQLAALAHLGYVPHPLEAQAIDSLRQREGRDALKRLVVAGLGAMQAMMYAVTLYAGAFNGIEPTTRDFFRWLGFLVATPVVLYSAKPFFSGALREWRTRNLSMDTPVALAVAVVYIASLYEAMYGSGDVYFDSVSMFVFFLLGGRYIEMRARHRAGDLVDALARLQPATAERKAINGFEQVGVYELNLGDTVRVAPGATLPADGVLLNTACHIDESLLTGESTPRLRESGESVVAGSLLLDGPIEIQVERIGADTVLAGMVRMMTRAASERPKLTRLADDRAARFVVRILTLTLVTGFGWWYFDPSRAFSAALAVLVVSCPCAFALAVPAALTRAIAVLAQRGVLVVDADALETLANADHMLFDKTGTLTEPSFARADVVVARGSIEQALTIAAALEQGNQHPLANAMRSAAQNMALPEVSGLRHIAGYGVEGFIGDTRYRLGCAEFAVEKTASASHALILADEIGCIAEFPIHERIRPGVAAALATLRGDGLTLELLSGDAAMRVKDVAAQLGIDHWQGASRPDDKLRRLAQLRESGHIVAMVGDGINDAPVLAGADVAISVGSGAAIAQATSGILLVNDCIHRLPEARKFAQNMLSILRQNLRWALIYNLSVVPLAAFGFVPPWLAAIGMSASSLVVILNSQRLGRRSGLSMKNVDSAPAVVVKEALA